MNNKELRMFSMKELFLMAHDSSGNSYLTKSIPQKKRKKMMDDNMHLLHGMVFENGFPINKPYNGPTDFELVSYLERKRHTGHNQALHFFLNDYQFRNPVWYNLEHTAWDVAKFDYIMAPDLSLWRNLPTEFPNMKNLYRTRFVGSYLQMNGFTVIPTASWGGLQSFSYCFCGLPHNSVLAVTAMGSRKDANKFDRWCYGLRRLEEDRTPALILVYGDEVEVPGLSTPLQFMQSFIRKRFRNGK